jgi:acyl-CoA thioesterase FadM
VGVSGPGGDPEAGTVGAARTDAGGADVEAPMSEGERVLRDDGYRFVAPVVPRAGDYDAQGHLNNAATVRLFNDLRIAYVQGEVGPAWVELLGRETIVVAAREVHVLYESEGFPGESFVGAMRYVRREGKASVLEERLVEATTARPVARAWVVQLLVQNGGVVDWPDLYFERVAEIEGCAIPVEPRRHTPWGPPAD